MAGSKFAYVRDFELADSLLPETYMVLRVDGHAFHRFSEDHSFSKPNDLRALQLMDASARHVMENYPDIVFAFGESDEFSFLFRKSTVLYKRRHAKILSTVTSLFTSAYVFHWGSYFPEQNLLYPPSFDGRIVLYPNAKVVKDYFAWRQVDTHINNLYNTTFWVLIQNQGKTTQEAHSALRGTSSGQKQEILFKVGQINCDDVDLRFKKGSIVVREQAVEGETVKRNSIQILHCDIVKPEFWDEHPMLLGA
ncbi:tRNAHis guanylyltransferase-domain-containing protein [Flagelloscypha sp. PMI_526]|nr:tRNAHis guanylyltransferase-domain-containing protein [Flagelloscypha sp. PMI_526]